LHGTIWKRSFLHMRAMVFDRYGEPEVMSLREVPVPSLKMVTC
jgi:hypothetical protein